MKSRHPFHLRMLLVETYGAFVIVMTNLSLWADIFPYWINCNVTQYSDPY